MTINGFMEMMKINPNCTDGKKYLFYMNKYYDDNRHLISLYPHTEEVLEKLKEKDIVLGIITSREFNEILEEPILVGILSYFDYVIHADDTKKHKPDPSR